MIKNIGRLSETGLRYSESMDKSRARKNVVGSLLNPLSPNAKYL